MADLHTELSDRVLRFDGVSLIDTDQVQEFLLRGLSPSNLRVPELTDDIKIFNYNNCESEQISSELLEPIKFDLSWNIPSRYLYLDITQYIMDIFSARVCSLSYTNEQIDEAINRISLELEEIKKRALTDLLRTIIFVIDTFKQTNQIYGVGRGSSCASYILFLIGLHMVDPIKFEIPMEEFFHD